MTYKRQQLTAYNENLQRLLDDTSFRTELTRFSIDSEEGVLKEQDRQHVMPVLLRILYGMILYG